VAAEHADELRRTFESLTDRLREDISRHFRHFDDRAREFASALEHDQQSAAASRLIDVIAQIDEAESLSEVLDRILTCANAEAPFAVVWLVDGEQLLAWGQKPDAESLDVALPDAGVVADAARSGAPAVDTRPERMPALRVERAHAQKMAAVPVLVGGDVVAVVYAEDPQDEAFLELVVRYGSRRLEAMTAIRLAALSGRLETRRRSVVPFRNDRDGGADSEADADAAQRYARLLVSEIKFYHEAEVAEGRRRRDLMARLGGEIARARVFYEQRVAETTRRRADYFHDELVRTLADGDPSLVEPRPNGIHAAE